MARRREYSNRHKRSLDLRRCVRALEQARTGFQLMVAYAPTTPSAREVCQRRIQIIDNVLRTVNRSVQGKP